MAFNVGTGAEVQRPLATVVIGGIFSLIVSTQYLSVPAAVGLIAVFGVAMLDGTVLISVLNGLRGQGIGIRKIVVQGALPRPWRALITALVVYEWMETRNKSATTST